MKDKEVIETLNDMKGVFGKRGHSQYSLYSIDRAITAIEKQIPKKPIEHTKLPNNRFSYLCSNCNRLYWDREFLGDYCSSCGQKFDLD